jgi:DNA-binding MarR family transcriptional regulator
MTPATEPADGALRAVEPGDGDLRAVEAVRALARASSVLERASSELSLAHYRVLSAISAGEERATFVARRLALGKPTVSAAVSSLCQRGLLVRAGVEGDLRAVELRLTVTGAAVLDRIEAEMVRRIEHLAAKAPAPHLLMEQLVELGAAIDQVAAERAAGRSDAGRSDAGRSDAGRSDAARSGDGR